MSLEIYTPDYSNRHELSHATSIQMSEYYNDIGKIIITVPVNDYNINTLKADSVVYDTVRGSTYILRNIKTDTSQNRITANGYTTNELLNKRIIASPQTIKNIEADCYSAVNSNLRGLPRLQTAPVKGLSDRTDMILHGGELLTQIMPILNEHQLGHRMVWDYEALKYTFEIYKGKDLTQGIHAVIFSDEQGTAKNLTINVDDSIFKNVAYVTSEYNDNKLVEVVGDATGEDRYEQWFDIAVSPEEGESEAQFRQRMRSHGAMELGKLVKRQSFSVTIDPTEFGKIYNLGDLVSCVSARFSVSFNVRITGVKYRMDANGTQTELVLGEPVLTAIGGLNLNG